MVDLATFDDDRDIFYVTNAKNKLSAGTIKANKSPFELIGEFSQLPERTYFSHIIIIDIFNKTGFVADVL